MATLADCELVLDDLLARLRGVDPAVRRRLMPDRTVSLTISDLGCVFTARMVDGELGWLRRTDDPAAQVRLAVSSNDLVALGRGQLTAGTAWTEGRLRVDAGVLDLLRLRVAL